jgi:NADH-quinone oxidoreductase subunit H
VIHFSLDFLPLASTVYYEDWWVQIVKSILIFAVIFNFVPLVLLGERKLLGRFQSRYGPTRVGPWGLLQPVADIVKLVTKENFRPISSVGFLFALAPALSIITAVAAFAIIPFGPVVHIGSERVGLYGIDVGIGPLYAFAIGAISFYGIMLGGWSSGSKYSFLGSMRAAAQLISYEVSFGLALVGIIIQTGSLSLVSMVQAQGHGYWFIAPQFFGFLVFLVAGFAETNRPPFDLAEADAELVGGYNTEFGGSRFGAYFLAEYMNIMLMSALAVTFFFGGWLMPFGIPNPGWAAPIIFLGKMFLFVGFFIWVRATLPRLRYDQLMSFGWKILLPLATLNALVTAIVVVVS